MNDPDPTQEIIQTHSKTLYQIEILLSIVPKLLGTLPPEFRRMCAKDEKSDDSLEFHLLGGFNSVRRMRVLYAKLVFNRIIINSY